MKHLAISLAVLMLMWSGDAKAKKGFYESGNDLFTQCTSKNVAEEMACGGFITGVVDTSHLICPPKTVNRGQLRDIVIKYLKENPQVRHNSGAGLVLASLITLFPCPNIIK